MIILKHFDTLYNLTMHILSEASRETKDFIGGIIAALYKNPTTIFFGRILQNMNIIVIEDSDVDYDDPSPHAFRDPTFIRVFCGGLKGLSDRNNGAWCRLATMGVDIVGNIYIGEQFIGTEIFKEANDDEAVVRDIVKGVLLHESMHYSELTFLRQGSRNHSLWNIVTDIYINYQLIKNGYKLPSMGYLPKTDGTVDIHIPGTRKKVQFQIYGKSAEELYDEVMKFIPNDDKPKQPPPPQNREPLKQGDPVYNKKTGKYGIVISTSPLKVTPVTAEEAKIQSELKYPQ